MRVRVSQYLGVTPPRSRRTVVQRQREDRDPLMRDREDYKLVFISSSDSSSREELQSDDGSSTCSGLVAGSDCDWDYYEPCGGSSGEPCVGTTGAAAVAGPGPVSLSLPSACAVDKCVPVPIPVPIPVPFPVLVPVPWTPDLTIRIQHLWSLQQLVTVTLNDGQMNQRLSEDLRLAALKHFQDLTTRAQEPPLGEKHAVEDTPNDVSIDKSVICEKNGTEVHECKENTIKSESDNQVVSEVSELELGESIEDISHDELAITTDKTTPTLIEVAVSDKTETDGVVLKNYKSLGLHEQDKLIVVELKEKEECFKEFMEVEDDESVSSTSSDDSDRGDKSTKRFYKFNQEEESEAESSEDEDSSGEFSMASSLSSSPGSGRFKRVYVVNDSDSDLGELPEYQDDSAQEDGEVTLLRHVNMDGEVRLSTILQEETAKADEDSASMVLQDSLECGVLGEQELPESEHESALSLPLSEELAADNVDMSAVFLDSPKSVRIATRDHYYDENTKMETGEFLSREIAYCDKAAIRTGADFILKKEGEGSDEECGKLCETRGSNTSDEFSGTESMELEQGQVRAAGPVTASGESWRETGRYTSLVMITQEPVGVEAVSVVTSDTTTLSVPEVEERYTLTLDTTQTSGTFPQDDSEVHVVTGNGTTAVVILEEGLPDDDSWVEDLDRDELVTTTEDSSEDDTSYVDREEELRGYNPRSAIDFTLHTIVEESCEESEVELERNRPTELEKYFFYGVGDGLSDSREVDTMSETSSIHSEGLESLGGYDDGENEGKDPAELASSRLEKYFLSGLLGCSRRDSDGSVGSDSEGKPSPEQRRKRLVRARGTGRQHSNSQDNLNESEQQDEVQVESEGSSTETDSHDDLSNSFEKNDGQFDTVKRTKKKKRSVVSAPSLELLEAVEDPSGSGGREEMDSDDGNKTPQPEFLLPVDLGSTRNKQQSRDSGFMGSCDDLLKENKDVPSSEVPGILEVEIEKVPEVKKVEETVMPQVKISPPTGLIRKDSFNNWSSDEETNLMMSKMRQFFKTMVASQPKVSSPTVGARNKPPQLVHFESELTRLMKTVPGIRDEQVKEIVEYLSSEDTWSDSYDSSDYTSSDLEGCNKKTALQEEISASCRQIISNFEAVEDPITTSAEGLNKDTAFVYQRLVASFSKLDAPSSDSSASHNSPPLIAKVMQHIGSRLVALMHEVSSAEGGSPKSARYHRRLQPKLSTTSTTEDEEDSIEDYSPLPRSKSHDPLIEENRQEASDNERFSWRGSFESALMASDSRTRLASGGEGSVSASALALAAKRRSAGDLLFKTSSREQLDRVRSCGSIGGSVEDKIWGLRHQKRRRSSVPDSGGSNDGDDDSEEDAGRSTTLPRSLQSSCAATNSLPRLPTTPTSTPTPSIYKAHSVHQVSASKSVVSARYRPPGYSSRSSAVAPPRRDARRRAAQTPSPCNLSSPPSVEYSLRKETRLEVSLSDWD
ncbi:calcium ion-regulated exocytosis of neurotransmitter [Homalodisca vitripennis]|nr:calcium ion-regulated exocytosis of neurotransmitter [Homalodisca vitripennis]